MTQHTDRRGAATPGYVFSLEAETLIQRSTSEEAMATLAVADIDEVRLSVEMAGQASQVVCRVTAKGGHYLTFGSMRWIGPASWSSTSDTFSALLGELHDALAKRGDTVRYIEGQSRRFLLAMFVLGLLITGLAGYYFVDLFFIKEIATGLFLFPVLAIGLWLMRLFWPNSEKTYDPTIYRT
jgi:hypothetical protein